MRFSIFLLLLLGHQVALANWSGEYLGNGTLVGVESNCTLDVEFTESTNQFAIEKIYYVCELKDGSAIEQGIEPFLLSIESDGSFKYQNFWPSGYVAAKELFIALPWEIYPHYKFIDNGGTSIVVEIYQSAKNGQRILSFKREMARVK